MRHLYLFYAHICRILLDFIKTNDVTCFSSRFEDIDGDGFDTDMGYLVEGLDELERYCRRKGGEDDGN